MGNKKTILAIDDVSLNLILLRDILSKHFDVRVAKSGDMALHIFKATQVDLILLDIEMPGMSGFDFLKIIRDKPNTKDIPVIFVTSHLSADFMANVPNMDVVDYIIKPFNPEALLKKVWAALNMTVID